MTYTTDIIKGIWVLMQCEVAAILHYLPGILIWEITKALIKWVKQNI